MKIEISKPKLETILTATRNIPYKIVSGNGSRLNIGDEIVILNSLPTTLNEHKFSVLRLRDRVVFNLTIYPFEEPSTLVLEEIEEFEVYNWRNPRIVNITGLEKGEIYLEITSGRNTIYQVKGYSSSFGYISLISLKDMSINICEIDQKRIFKKINLDAKII